jgi:flagellar biosynthesis/type III secretory pathway chaperone
VLDGKITRMQTKGAQATLPPLPVAFWRSTDVILKAWKDLEEILSEEWDALRVRDLTRIWQVAEKKKRQTAQVQELESRLVAFVDRILAHYGSTGGEIRWNKVRRILHQKDVAPLEAWRASREESWRHVLAVNERHQQWMEDQVTVVRALAEIVSGRGQEKSPLYGPAAQGGSGSMSSQSSQREQPVTRCRRGVI